LQSPKYNTRSHSEKSREENNNINSNSNDDASETDSEINHIEEIFHILDGKEKSNEISTELRIQGIKNNKTNTNHLLLGLLDTGATSVFVKKAALQHIDPQIKQINVQVKG
jgi:hypothetical protein